MARKKSGPTDRELELRREVKRKFRDAMTRHNIPTQSAAASQIGVKKATFSLYMKEKATPSSFVLLKACEKWGLSIHYGGIDFTASAFAGSGVSRSATIPEQRSLFEALSNLRGEGIGITIGKRGPDSVELNLQIRFSA
jgi:hypothetical protein